MGSQTEIHEERLKSFLAQLQAEYGILDRIVYKGKNQHRRCFYFQHLLKVRRDLRVLQVAHLEDILNSCFQVINGTKPNQKVHFLQSLKRRKCTGGKPNFMERLLGVARLLAQMVEPMLKAATEISTLLARSFFMGFSLTVMSLLARVRVLVQQILLDIVSVFNMVSSISQTKHSVKLIENGIEVYREYYPVKAEVISLECVWETDKFILMEKINKSESANVEGVLEGNAPLGDFVIRYESVEALLRDDVHDSTKAATNYTTEEGSTPIEEDRTDSHIDGTPLTETEDGPSIVGPPTKNTSLEVSSRSEPMKKMAFVSVKIPASSMTSVTDVSVKETKSEGLDEKDPFFSLLTAGNLKGTLF